MKGNKIFVYLMISVSTISLIAVVVIALMGLIDTRQEKLTTTLHNENINNIEESAVGKYQTADSIIEGIEDEKLFLVLMEENKKIELNKAVETIILDQNGQVMPFTNLEIGDTVEVEYQVASQKAIQIIKKPGSWEKERVVEYHFDSTNQQLIIGANSYRYGEGTLLHDENNQRIKIEDLGQREILHLKGVGDEVHSIRVIEREGYIGLESLPIKEGILEIDLSRQIPIEKIEDLVAVTPGTHKVSIYLKGYEPVSYELEINSGETMMLSLEGARQVYGKLDVQVLNGIKDYEIRLGDKVYASKDTIEVLEGIYDVVVTAQGFKPWGMKVPIKGNTLLQVQLHEEVKQVEENGESVEQEEELQEEELPAGYYEINISTEPAGAVVYINDVKKGITPFKTTLSLGDYAINLEKEGYEDYSTSIIIDNSDNQNSYFYMLSPKL